MKPKPNKRVMYAVAAGALLALVFLMRSRSQAATGVAGAADPTATDPSTGLPYGASFGGGTPAYGSTFADNGAAAASSLDTVASSLSALDTEVQGIGSFLSSAPWLQGQTPTPNDSGTTATTTPNQDPFAIAGGILALAKQLAPAPAKPTPTPTAKTAPKPTTTAGFHTGHSAGHDYYLPGTGWVSKARYSAAKKK